MQHASATEVVRIVTSLYAGGGEGAGAPTVKIVSDDRTNSVLVSGERSQRLRLRTLVTHLDTPLDAGGDTQVRYLRYADAERSPPSSASRSRASPPRHRAAGGAGGAGGAGASAGGAGRDRPQHRHLGGARDERARRHGAAQDHALGDGDRRSPRHPPCAGAREAILVEMSADKAMDVGINWAILDRDAEGNDLPAGGFNTPVGGVGIGEVIAGIRDPDNVVIPSGLTIGIGQIVDSGTSWAALIRALEGRGNTNIIATPSVVTLDNEEAEIKIAQEVPFITGQFTTDATGGGVQNPFQTVTREEVGNILKITPQINEGDSVVLKISQEASNIAASSQQVSSADLITNKRTITTKVMVEDGGLIVLGGLISDQVNEQKSQVPLLGSIPILGELFKTRSTTKTKTNLMVFIRPRILRDGVDAAIETNAKSSSATAGRGAGCRSCRPSDSRPASLESFCAAARPRAAAPPARRRPTHRIVADTGAGRYAAPPTEARRRHPRTATRSQARANPRDGAVSTTAPRSPSAAAGVPPPLRLPRICEAHGVLVRGLRTTRSWAYARASPPPWPSPAYLNGPAIRSRRRAVEARSGGRGGSGATMTRWAASRTKPRHLAQDIRGPTCSRARTMPRSSA
jgi:hypothetical protein